MASHYLATYRVEGEQLRGALETISSASKKLIAAIAGNAQDIEAPEPGAKPDYEEAAA